MLIQLENNGYEAYLVGGFVRDALLFRKTNDFDIATNAKPKEIIEIFGRSKKESEYGSINYKVDDYNIDITTYRKDLEYKNRKPVCMEYTTNLIEDAKRRDFTINAMYMNKNEEIIDLFDSKVDLSKKIIRTIGNPIVRLKEDPLRILRAIRFSSVYHLEIDKELRKAIKKEKKNLATLSFYRIKKELDAILLANGFSLLKQFDLLNELGITSKKIVYVEDLAGLWAQIECTHEYPEEKNFKKHKKSIKNQIKCGTINMLSLYENGYYDSRVVATILHFPLKRLEKMNEKLPIHSRKEILLSSFEIESCSGVHGRCLGALLSELEKLIVLGKIKNDKESIKKYLKDRR